MLKQETIFYNHFYKNKTILIKISGQEIARDDFKQTVDDLKKLADKGVKFVLVFGGGKQISGKIPADKQTAVVNGIRNTTSAILETAVEPAYNEIRDKLEKLFTGTENINFLNPKDIVCRYKNEADFGQVGTVENIILPKQQSSIMLAGFFGTVNGNKVNINADEILEWFLNSAIDINEVFVLTTTGGVLDKNDQKIHLITEKTLDKIIQGNDDNITVSAGMLKKMREIKKILPQVAKIVITDIYGIPKEIETWHGNGTLIIDINQHVIEKIAPEEKIVAEEILNFFQKKNIISRLSSDEMRNVLDKHYLFKIKGSPLGGFSLLNKKDNQLEIKALWSNSLGTGIIDILLSHIKETADKNLIIIAKNEFVKNALEEQGFELVGEDVYFWKNSSPI